MKRRTGTLMNDCGRMRGELAWDGISRRTLADDDPTVSCRSGIVTRCPPPPTSGRGIFGRERVFSANNDGPAVRFVRSSQMPERAVSLYESSRCEPAYNVSVELRSTSAAR